MARTRSTLSQSRHDKAVQKRAEQLQRRGFDVKADLKGFKQPDTIRGVRPDIDARKGKQRVIVEVETPESRDDRRAQRQERAFSRAAKQSRSTRFEKIVTGKDVVRPATAVQIRRDVKVTSRDLRVARKGMRKAARKR